MPKFIDLEQGTDAWREYRLQGIGGSDANIIAAYFMGIDYPYGNWAGAEIYRLWAEKTGRIPMKAQKDNSWGDYKDPKEHGRQTESIARGWYMVETGLVAAPCFVVHDINQYLFASLDGFDEETRTVQEIKCPKEPGDHRRAKEGEVPEKYMAQFQHNMFVAGAKLLHYVSFYQDEGVIVPVEPDAKFLEQLREGEEQFMDWVRKKEFPLPTGEKQRDDKEWAKAVQDWFDVVNMRRAADEAERSVRLRIMRLMTGAKVRGCGARASIRVRPKSTVKQFEKAEGLEIRIEHEGSPENE